MLLNFELVLLLTLGNLCYLECSSLISFWRDRDIRKAAHLCTKRWELMGAIRAGGPLQTLVQPNQTIVLQCRYCEDPEENEDDDTGMWTFVDIVRGSAPVRVPRPIGDGSQPAKRSFLGSGRTPRIVQTEDRSLALRKPRTTDLGLYQCRRDNDNSTTGSTVQFLIDMDIALYEEQLEREKENNLNEDEEDEDYKENTTEMTVKDEENDFETKVPCVNGTFADWPTYQKDYLDALEKSTALSSLHLEAISEWTSWTDCRDCWTTKYGIRARRGVCVLRLPLRESENDDVILKELAGLPALACRSALLSQLHPKVGEVARKVPDFIEFDYQGCNGVCMKNDSKSHGSILHRLVYLFRHRRDAPLITHRKLTINAGESLVIVCPDATAETPVHWEKDGEPIGGGSANQRTQHKRNPVEKIITRLRQAEHWVSGELVGIKAEPDNTPIVDSAGVLKIKSAAPRNSGSYVCSVNGAPRGTFQVEVIVRSTLSFDDLMRHFAYVSLVLLSCIMIWCGVVICVSLRERFRKKKYSKLPQSDQPSSPPKLDTPGSPTDTPTDKSSEESTIENAESAVKRKSEHKPAPHHPSRKSSRAANNSGPPSPRTASYHKISSRLRIRNISRLMSRSSASNNDIELVRLLPPKSSRHLTNYRTDHPGPSRRCHRRQYSTASSSTADLNEVETPVDRGSVIVLSQQLFPASQKTLRPVPPSSVSLTNQRQTRGNRNSIEPVSTQLPTQEREQFQTPPALPCTWVPSAISTSVLRARNSLKQAKAASSSPNTSKLYKPVHPDELLRQSSPKMCSSADQSIRANTPKKPRKRRSKSNVYGKPRKSFSQASKTSKGKRLKKHRGFSSSPASTRTKSPIRKKPTITAKPTSSPRQIRFQKSTLSRTTASPLHVTKQNSPLCPAPCSPGKSSPRLSLLYKAQPSAKPAVSSSISRDHVSSMSFLSNSAGFSATDQQDVRFGNENPTEPTRSSADIIPPITTDETNEVSTPNDQTKSLEERSSKRLTIQTPNVLVSKFTLNRPVKTDTKRPPASMTSRPTPIYLPPPDSYSQQSMFEIKKIGEKPNQPHFSALPSPTNLSRQPSILKSQTVEIEQRDSLEKLKLVAAFLETSVQKKSVSSSRSHSQSSDCKQTRRSQVHQPIPRSISQGSFLLPPSAVIASPRQSEISLPTPPPPPVKSGTSSGTQCKVAHAESVLSIPNEPWKLPITSSHPKPTHQMSSKILTTFSRMKSPLQSKPSLQVKTSSKSQQHVFTEVSRQLLPALVSPCAIALPDHAPVVKRLIKTGSPFLPNEFSFEFKKLKSTSRAVTIQSSMSSVRSSTSTQSAFNTITEHHEILPKPENNAKRSVSTSNTDTVSRLRQNVDPQQRVASSHSSIRTKSPVKDFTIQLSQGRMVGPSSVQLKKQESTSQPGSSKCIGSRADLFTTFREIRSEDVFGSSTRFRTPRSETENRGSTHSDWIAAHHKTNKKPTASNERLQCSDNSKEAAMTTLRKIASDRFSKHKGYFVRQKPVVDKFQIILVDTDKLKKENVTPDHTESYRREPSFSENKDRSKSRSRSVLFESVTQSVTPATAIAFPQIISANPLWPINPSTSGGKVVSKHENNEPQPIPSESQHSSQRRSQPIPETTRSPESIRSLSLSTTHLPTDPPLQEFLEVVSEKDLTKPTKTNRSKSSIRRVRNRMKKTSHVTMPTITGPLEFKFKQGAKYDTFNINATEGPLSATSHSQSSTGIFNFTGGLRRGFVPHSLKLKLTRSLPQASGSPSLSKLICVTDVTKSLREVKTKPSMNSTTLKSPRSQMAPLYLQSSFHEGSRFANQLLATEPSPVSSHTTQVEKGDIDNTCDVEVQSAIRSAQSLHQSEQAIQRPFTVLRDESTSFGSLCESTVKSRRVRLATTEMASQVSNVRTTPEEVPKRTNSKTFIKHLPSKRQPFITKKSTSVATARSQRTTIPPPVSQKHEVDRTNFKGRRTTSPPCHQHFEAPTLNNPQCLPDALPSNLPVPVHKKSVHRIKPGESRTKPSKIPVHSTAKPTRRVVRKQPIPPSPKSQPGRTGQGNLPPKSARVKSPAPRRSPQRPSLPGRQESPTLNLRSKQQHSSKIPPRPLKSCILRPAAEQSVNDTKTEDTKNSSALEDYNSHHVISQVHIASPVTEECTYEKEETAFDVKAEESNQGALHESLQSSAPSCECTLAFLDPTKPPFSGMLVTDVTPAFSGALANAAQGVIAISMTRTVSSAPSVPNERDAGLPEPDIKKSFLSIPRGDEICSKQETNSQNSSRCQSRSSSHPALRRKYHQKTKRNQSRRSLASYPHSPKTGPSLRKDCPNQTLSSEVFVFEAQKPTRTTSTPDQERTPSRGLKVSSFLTDTRNSNYRIQEVKSNSTCPDFLQDGFVSVRGISTTEFKRKKTKHEGQPNIK